MNDRYQIRMSRSTHLPSVMDTRHGRTVSYHNSLAEAEAMAQLLNLDQDRPDTYAPISTQPKRQNHV
jgi:hypothetical protein